MSRRVVIRFVRTWLPAIVVLGGILVIAIGRDEIALEGGAGIIGAGLSIWLFNWLFRVGTSNERDREAEEEARAFYDRHGVWPDEVTAGQPEETSREARPGGHRPPAGPPRRAADDPARARRRGH